MAKTHQWTAASTGDSKIALPMGKKDPPRPSSQPPQAEWTNGRKGKEIRK